MAFEHYIRSEGKDLRMGYTTGTCAALAAAGAAEGLLTGHIPEYLSLVTPKGIEVGVTPVCSDEEQFHYARCGVVKDGGDDKDVTNGLTIIAIAHFPENIPAAHQPSSEADRIVILGGHGVGRVTKPGLDQKVGEAAINHVPREMIRREVLRVCEEQGYAGCLEITIEVPEGEKAALKTLNGRMGIEGGISIIGTTGIVEPMSMKAYSDSVRLLIRQIAAEMKENDSDKDRKSAARSLILTPGNYGLNYLRQQGFDLMDVPVVMCSNYIGDALDEASANGFDTILLVGHAGKMIKLAAGIMNTHSSMADGRLEIITAHAALAGASAHTCKRLMECVTTDACIEILMEHGKREQVMKTILEKIQMYLTVRSSGALCGLIMFSNEYGELGRTFCADQILKSWRQS